MKPTPTPDNKAQQNKQNIDKQPAIARTLVTKKQIKSDENARRFGSKHWTLRRADPSSAVRPSQNKKHKHKILLHKF